MRLEFRTDKRGYTLTLDRDMFGAFVLFRRWYGLLNRRGGVKRQVFLQEDAAMREVRRIERLRIRRGYRRLG
jgi:predicted DNA-binding WGR domain protein